MDDRKQHTFRFSSEEIAGFCEQIAILLNGGIPLYEGAYMIYNEMEDKNTKAVMKQIDDSLRDNKSFHEALKESGAFPAYMIYMVRIGEITGKLETVMGSLSHYYERESSIKSSIRSVISYPIMMFAMMAVVLLVLVFKILPMFETVFTELSSGAEESTKNMMDFGMQAGKIIAVILAVIFVVVLAIWIYSRTKTGRKSLFQCLCNFPITKKMMEEITIGKFVSSMALMISSGMESEEALDMAETVIEHKKINEKIHKCQELMKKGDSLEDALKETRLITGMRGRMISVGAKTGVVDTIFEKLSVQYDEEIESGLNGLAGGIETVLVVSLSVIVGAVLISVMLPLISIISAIG